MNIDCSLRSLACAAAALLALPALAQADFPSKPIVVIAPASAGSGTDIVARLVGEQMSATLKQPFITENRVGGGGKVGMDVVANAPPDGYMLLLSTDATIAIQPHFDKDAFDPSKNLTPIGEISSFALVVLVGADSPIHTIAELKQAAATTPRGLAYGMGGRATGGHIIGETLQRSLNVPLTAVAYPSAARAVTDLLGGHVQVAISDVLSAVSYVKAGKLRAIGVAGATRSRCLPDVPTLKEQGVPFDLPYSYGLLTSPHVPPAVLDKLSKALKAALDTPAVRQKLQAECQEPAAADDNPATFSAHVRDHYAQWGALIRNANITIE